MTEETHPDLASPANVAAWRDHIAARAAAWSASVSIPAAHLDAFLGALQEARARAALVESAGLPQTALQARDTALRARLADHITAELVCCQVYDTGDVAAAEKTGHAICYWGEAAARIVTDPQR